MHYMKFESTIMIIYQVLNSEQSLGFAHERCRSHISCNRLPHCTSKLYEIWKMIHFLAMNPFLRCRNRIFLIFFCMQTFATSKVACKRFELFAYAYFEGCAFELLVEHTYYLVLIGASVSLRTFIAPSRMFFRLHIGGHVNEIISTFTSVCGIDWTHNCRALNMCNLRRKRTRILRHSSWQRSR